MTEPNKPEALRLAELLELAPEDGIEPQTAEDAAAELLRQHARIAELEARIKTMAEEHADELMVAHLDGRMRGCSTEPSGEYPALPDLDGTLWRAIGQHRKADTPAESSAAAKAVDTVVHTLLRAYVDADRAARPPADSVLEDAARYRWLRERSSTMFVNISINGEGAEIAATLDSAVDAARKQGANHG